MENEQQVGTWIPVESSNLKQVMWNAWGILSVEFINGSIYDYMDVPREVFDGLLSAESKGQYFKEHVKAAFPYYRRIN